MTPESPTAQSGPSDRAIAQAFRDAGERYPYPSMGDRILAEIRHRAAEIDALTRKAEGGNADVTTARQRQAEAIEALTGKAEGDISSKDYELGFKAGMKFEAEQALLASPPAQVAGSGLGEGIMESFLGAMQRKHGYRPQLWGNGEPINSRDFDRLDGFRLALAAQPAPVVGGSDWYAEQHARDSKELRKLCESRDFYKRRCDSLQALQPNMRDPERKAVCDILANGTTTALSTRPAESVAQGGEEPMAEHCHQAGCQMLYGGCATPPPATGSGGEAE